MTLLRIVLAVVRAVAIAATLATGGCERLRMGAADDGDLSCEAATVPPARDPTRAIQPSCRATPPAGESAAVGTKDRGGAPGSDAAEVERLRERVDRLEREAEEQQERDRRIDAEVPKIDAGD